MGVTMAMRFTVEGDGVRLTSLAAVDADDGWPDPIKVYLLPPAEELTEAIRGLKEGAPLVIELDPDADLGLDDLVDVVRAAAGEGHDVVVRPGNRAS